MKTTLAALSTAIMVSLCLAACGKSFDEGFCHGYRNGCLKHCTGSDCEKTCDEKLAKDTVYQGKCAKK